MVIVKTSSTDDYKLLEGFFLANGLEFPEEEAVATDYLCAWKAVPDDNEAETASLGIFGGCVLAKREGEFICDGIATATEARGTGLGKELLNLMLAEIAAYGGSRLYLVARAPEFFAKHGFIEVSRENAPNFFECFTCPQYNVSCFPKVMYKTIDQAED